MSDIVDRGPGDHEALSERLHDYVDGVLPEADTRELEILLAARVDLRDEVEAIRALKVAARSLPETREPGRDLWPEIRDALTPGTAALESKEVSWWRRNLWVPAGAAVAAVAALALLTLMPAGDSPVDTADRVPTGIPVDTAAGTEFTTSHVMSDKVLGGMVRGLELECRGAGKEAMASLSAHPAGVDNPATRILTGDLATLDAAIAETRLALEANPESPELLEMLVRRYQQKLALLHEASRVARLV